jgi:hypothetical protein
MVAGPGNTRLLPVKGKFPILLEVSCRIFAKTTLNRCLKQDYERSKPLIGLPPSLK